MRNALQIRDNNPVREYYCKYIDLCKISAPGRLGMSSSSVEGPVPGVQVSSTLQSKKPTSRTFSNNNLPYSGLLSLFLITSTNSGNKCTQCCKQFPCNIPSALLSSISRVYLYALEMKVSVTMLNTSIKLVFVLPVANFVAVMMKA
jgi:hypothetical protein